MKSVTLQPINRKLAVQTETRILDTLLAEQCPVMMACGGQGICATCHVYIRSGMDSVSPMTDRERRTLALITGAQAQSRLSCQCRVIGEGVEVVLPEGMYVESFDDILSLIGKRTRQPILHPKDGRILIQKDKIITRSAIAQLEGMDFNVSKVDLG